VRHNEFLSFAAKSVRGFPALLGRFHLAEFPQCLSVLLGETGSGNAQQRNPLPRSSPCQFCPDILSSKANVISATQYRHELDLLWTRLMSTQMAVIGGSIGLRGWLPDAI
jgi:hypothetical protein